MTTINDTSATDISNDTSAQEIADLHAKAENTAITAHRVAGGMYLAIVTGERVKALPRDAGTEVRAKCSLAKRSASVTLDAFTGFPGKSAGAEKLAAWFLAGAKRA